MRLLDAQLKLRRLIVNFFGSLAHCAVLHPKGVLASVALVTLAAAPGLRWLKLRTDGHALVAQNAPEVVYDKAIREQFGIEDNIVVLIRSGHPDGVFNPGTVQLVRDLTAELTRMPDINPSRVMSLATEPTFHFRPGTLVNQTVLEPPLHTKAELDQLREDLRRIQLYTGTLLSLDGKSTVILIGTPAGADRARLYQQVVGIVTAPQRRQAVQEEIAVTGAPVAEALLGIHILEDLGVPKALLGASTRMNAENGAWQTPANLHDLRLFLARRIGLVPMAILVMMLVFLLSFRNVMAMLVPLPGVLATLAFVFGLMGWFGVPIYLTIAVMPVLLTATGVTNDIYVFSRYFILLRENPASSHLELLRQTFDKMAGPVASTSLTTAIGFFSFGFSPLGPVRAFGLCTGVGVLFGLLYSFTGVPALLALLKPSWLLSRPRRLALTLPAAEHGTRNTEQAPAFELRAAARQVTHQSPLSDWFARFGLSVVRRRWWVLTLVVLVTALTPLGLRRLVVQDSWIDGFDPSSEFRRATLQVNEQFFGMHLLLVSFNAPETLTGEVPSSSLGPGTVALPGGLVKNPGLILGSTITFWLTGKAGAEAATNSAPREVWHSHIETANRVGNNIVARVPPRDAPANFWDDLRIAGRARFEILAHSHVAPEIIQSIGDLGSFIREHKQDAVGGVLSPFDYLTTTRFMVRTSDPEARRLPDDAAEIKLLWDYYGLARGRHRLQEVVDTNFWQSLTTVFLKDANFVDTAKLMSDIRAYEREHLAPKGIKIGFAGDVALSQSLIQGIVSTQTQSLFLSLLGIYLVTALLGGSLGWGVYCVLPSALAVLIKFAVMGWFGIPLGVATSMFAAMTLGIGVNCAIQLLEGFRQERAAGSLEPEALSRSLALTGPPALINTVAVSLGFGVLMLSQVPANARLGLLVVLGLVECLIVSLLLLPALLHWWPLQQRDQARKREIQSPHPA